MEVLRLQLFAMSLIALAFASLPSSINAQLLPPAPAPTSDGMYAMYPLLKFSFLGFLLFSFIPFSMLFMMIELQLGVQGFQWTKELPMC